MPGPIYYPEAYGRPVEGQPDPWDATDPKFEGFWAVDVIGARYLADNAENFMEIASRSEKPFFMYLAFNAPTTPDRLPKNIWIAIPLIGSTYPRVLYPNILMRKPATLPR